MIQISHVRHFKFIASISLALSICAGQPAFAADNAVVEGQPFQGSIQQQDIYEVKVRNTRELGRESGNGYEENVFFPDAPACLLDVAADIEAECATFNYRSNRDDDCIAIGWLVHGLGFNYRAVVDDVKARFGVNERDAFEDYLRHSRPEQTRRLDNGQFQVTTRNNHRNDDNLRTREAFVYFDAACNPVINPDSDVRGAALRAVNNYFYYSPISLIWKEGHDIEANTKLVQFPLNPHNKNNWYVWKASSEAPLLVYDPEQSGKITSSHQLFGEWTFGGKRVALSKATRPTSKWKNGYEALASLDANGDSKISGVELKPLALWFDRNQDGKSQEGEVVPVKETDLVTLYVTPDHTDATTKSISASLGYERMVNGDVVAGSSVDWYGAEYESPFEVSRRNAIKRSLGDRPSTENTLPVSKESIGALNPEDSQKLLSGTWVWKSEDPQFIDKRLKPAGVFALTDLGNGQVKGYSINAMNFGNLTSVNMKGLGAGTKSLNRKKRIVLKFSVTRSDDFSESEAVLSEDGSTLTGRTRVTTSRNGHQTSYSYSWTAKRAS